MKDFLVTLFIMTIISVILVSCSDEKNNPCTEATTIITTSNQITTTISAPIEPDISLPKDYYKIPTAKSKEEVNPITKKIKRNINGFELGMTLNDFKNMLNSREIELIYAPPETDDDKITPYLVYEIHGYTFIFDKTNTLKTIHLSSDNYSKGEYRKENGQWDKNGVGNGDLFSEVVGIYGDDYEIIDGFYVFFDGETYLSFSVTSNAVFRNYVEDWSITTQKPEETDG